MGLVNCSISISRMDWVLHEVGKSRTWKVWKFSLLESTDRSWKVYHVVMSSKNFRTSVRNFPTSCFHTSFWTFQPKLCPSIWFSNWSLVWSEVIWEIFLYSTSSGHCFSCTCSGYWCCCCRRCCCCWNCCCCCYCCSWWRIIFNVWTTG